MRDIRNKLIKPIFIGLVIGAIIAVGIFSIKVSIHGKFAKGTYVGGVEVSGMEIEEAAKAIGEERDIFLKEIVGVSMGNETQEASYGELGVTPLVDETISMLHTVDARSSSIGRWVLGAGVKKNETPLLVEIDYNILEDKLEEMFKISEIEPASAKFYFDERSKLQIEEERNGIEIDTEKLLDDLRSSAELLETRQIEITTKESEASTTKGALEEQRERIEEDIRHKFVLVDPVYSDNWETSLAEHLDWVEFAEKERVKIKNIDAEFVLGGGDLLGEGEGENIEVENFIGVEVNQDKLDEYVDAEISKWLDVEMEPVEIYTDENGEVVIEGKGSDGKEVQRAHLKKAIELAIENKIREVPIPVIDIPPQLTISEDLKELGIKERIAVGHTSYYGSPANRVHNIKTGAEKFNGLLIAPGEEFSFNQNLGQVDGSTGYRKELVIKKEGTVPEWGGGICQVSTTFYRAILFGGLPVTERREHSYAVSYYSQVLGHGLDATIYLGGQDLKFINDTNNYILVQTYTKGDYELYVIFYGVSDGRSVDMEGPYLSGYHSPSSTIYEETSELEPGQKKQVEYGHVGFNALWYRYITNADGETTTETITSNYKAVPAKVMVGTEN